MAPSAGRGEPVPGDARGVSHWPHPRRGDTDQRVLVVSDHTLISEAVRMALTSRGYDALGLAVPGQDRARRAFEQRVREFGPQIGIMLCELDRRMLFWEARSVVASTDTRWLLLTRSRDRAVWGAFVQAGALGVLPMTTSLETLTEALQRVAAGREVMATALREHVVELWETEGREARRVSALVDSLTPREMAVLSSLHDGLTVRLIADDSGVTEGTVRSQVKSILRKLQVSSQLAAVSAYRQRTQPTLSSLSEPGSVDPTG